MRPKSGHLRFDYATAFFADRRSEGRIQVGGCRKRFTVVNTAIRNLRVLQPKNRFCMDSILAAADLPTYSIAKACSFCFRLIRHLGSRCGGHPCDLVASKASTPLRWLSSWLSLGLLHY